LFFFFDKRAESEVAYKKLVRQVWFGVGLGVLIVLIVGGGMIGAFYGLNRDTFANSEYIWEGVFSLIACIIITLMGAALLRINKMRESWRVKIAKLVEGTETTKSSHPLGHRFKLWSEKYAMFLLPFVTVLREGLEAVVFIGGVGLGLPATAFPIPVITGFLAGIAVGYLIYKGGNHTSLQIFLIASTCFLYLVSAGLFSKAVGLFEMNKWNKLVGGDAAEAGSGPGSYDIRQSVWHVNCCNPEIDGGWGVFNSLFGWTNSASYGTVISYNLYWIVVILMFVALRFEETRGHYPFLKRSKNTVSAEDDESQTSDLKVEKHANIAEAKA